MHKAVECIPYDLDMWLALAQLETYENAKVVINKARRNLPNEVKIWVYAAKLEEAYGKSEQILKKIIKASIRKLAQNGVKLAREEWL